MFLRLNLIGVTAIWKLTRGVIRDSVGFDVPIVPSNLDGDLVVYMVIGIRTSRTDETNRDE